HPILLRVLQRPKPLRQSRQRLRRQSPNLRDRWQRAGEDLAAADDGFQQCPAMLRDRFNLELDDVLLKIPEADDLFFAGPGALFAGGLDGDGFVVVPGEFVDGAESAAVDAVGGGAGADGEAGADAETVDRRVKGDEIVDAELVEVAA